MLIEKSHWSGFWSTTIPGSSLELLWTTPSHRDPVGTVPQDQSLHKLQQVLDGADVKVGQPKARLWTWVIGKLVISDLR